MYCVQFRKYCGVCNKSYVANNYTNHLKSQGHIQNIFRDHCTNSTVVKIHFITK